MHCGKRIAAALAAVVVSLVFVACGGGGINGSAVPANQSRHASDDCNNYQSKGRAVSSASRNVQYLNCPSDPGGGSGSGGSSGGSTGGTCQNTGTCTNASCITDPTQSKCQVACVGTPKSCQGVPCNGSPETLGDIINNPKTNGDVVITEENSLWMNNGNVSSYTWGWMYSDASGNRYVQVNYANKAQWSASVSGTVSAWGLGVGVATPGGYSPIAPWNGMLPPGAFPKRCETQGATLV